MLSPEDAIFRRVTDDFTQVDVSTMPSKELMQLIHKELQQVVAQQAAKAKTLASLKDIIIAWDNAKGFVRVVVIFSHVLKWVAGVVIAFGIVWAIFKGKQ